ncbi:MAG: NAD(P)-binding protein, partial [Candidatus Thermoplasmatota archaeon]|nr:NAD(P)-binding protein [Candidatus Thermoplasmatota archaeon]
LIAKGKKNSNIVVITTDPEAAQKAADEGFVSINGDATKEGILEDAVIRKAASLIIATRKDDSNILIALTAKYLNPDVRVISRVTELENIKLLKKSGAEVIIAPAVTSGNMMATATTQPNVVHLLEDVMTASKGSYFNEREARPDELGGAPKKLKGVVVIGLVRKEKLHSFDELDKLKVRQGDHLLLLERK